MNLQAMQAGRARAAEARQHNAAERVRAFREWLAAGSVTRLIPEIPTDADFDLAGLPRK